MIIAPKSALDPNSAKTLNPLVIEDLADYDLSVANVTTVDAARTFWDKAVIVHGLHHWYKRKGVLFQQGQRISRHYYDLHCLLRSGLGKAAAGDKDLGRNCGRHARMFFNRPDFDLKSAMPGTLAVSPDPGMLDSLRRDYQAMAGMIFGAVPTFEEVLESIAEVEALVNVAEPQ